MPIGGFAEEYRSPSHTVGFSGEHEAEFDGLLTDSVAALLAVKAVELKR